MIHTLSLPLPPSLPHSVLRVLPLSVDSLLVLSLLVGVTSLLWACGSFVSISRAGRPSGQQNYVSVQCGLPPLAANKRPFVPSSPLLVQGVAYTLGWKSSHHTRHWAAYRARSESRIPPCEWEPNLLCAQRK